MSAWPELLPLAAWQGLWLTGGQWLLMLALGVGQMAVPYVLFSWALQRVAARHAILVEGSTKSPRAPG